MAFGLFKQAQAAKDALVGALAQKRLQDLISPYGHMLHLDIDSKAKVLRLQVLLEGETEPVSVQILGYRLEEVDGRAFLRFESIETSRAWMTLVARQLLPEGGIELPQGTPLAMLRLVL